MNLHDRVIFAAPIYEKRVTSHTIVYCTILITPERMIITLFPSGHIHPDMTDTEEDTFPVKEARPPGSARTRNSSRLESLESRARECMDRSADKILREENDAMVLRFNDIEEIVIIRVRTDSRSSRWLSILLAFYPLEPAAARYRVDYRLTISTPGEKYTLITPFSLPLKQVLVECLGNRVREIIDDYAPLL